MSGTRAPFGTTASGDPVEIFTLMNAHGLEARVTNYGGILVSLRVPDRRGHMDDVVLGYDSLEGYLRDTAYFGAIIGRSANRIARARFTLDGTTYRLTANDEPHHLHGGLGGFSRAVWRAEPDTAGPAPSVALEYTSADGDDGYPGTVAARVVYTLTDANAIVVDYFATTDRPTPVNLTHHSYFNLSGAPDILDHQAQILADRMTPVDESLVPTGAMVPVAGGPFDFRALTAVGARIGADDEQLRRARGYDHNFVLNRSGGGLSHAARVVDPVSGRTIDVATTEPGLQLYSGNFLDGTVTGKGGRAYGFRAGLCLETQHFPDAPNQPTFRSTILRPGDEYRSRTIYTFGVTP